MNAIRGLLERRPFAVALFLALVLLLVPYRVLLGPGVPSGRDLVPYFYPLKVHLAEAVRAGEMPWIDRFRWGGLPLLSWAGAAAFDPANALFVLLPTAVAAKAWMLLRVLTGAAGFAVFLRVTGLPPLSSALGALAWGASGITASSASFLSTSSAHAMLPWFAAALLHARGRRSPRAIALLGLSTALLLSASVPEPIVAAVILSLVLLAGRGDGDAVRERAGTVAHWGAGAVLGGLLAAPVLGAYLVTGLENVRGTAGALRAEFADQGALPVARLADLLVDGVVADWTTVSRAPGIPGYPYFPSLTPGRLAWTLALVGLVAGRGARLRGVSLVALGVLLALGPATPFHGFLGRLLAPAAALRYPEKYAVLFGFGLVWLAALGAAALERALGERRARAGFALLAALLLLDRDAVTHRLLPMSEASLLERRPQVLAALPAAGPGESPPRILALTGYRVPPGAVSEDPRSGGPAMAEWALPWSPGLFGVGTVLEADYDFALPREQFEWTLLLEAEPAGSPLPLALARAAGANAVVEAGPASGRIAGPVLRFLRDPVPPVRFVRRVVPRGDLSEQAKAYLHEGVPVDTAFPVRSGEGSLPAPGSVLRVSDRPSRLELDVEVAGPGAGYLLVCRPLVATRNATLDGRPVVVEDANVGFTGLAVPAGRHLVRLQPSRTWLIIAAVMSTLGLAVTAALLRSGRPVDGPAR